MTTKTGTKEARDHEKQEIVSPASHPHGQGRPGGQSADRPPDQEDGLEADCGTVSAGGDSHLHEADPLEGLGSRPGGMTMDEQTIDRHSARAGSAAKAEALACMKAR
jgi:hypothetical protein